MLNNIKENFERNVDKKKLNIHRKSTNSHRICRSGKYKKLLKKYE